MDACCEGKSADIETLKNAHLRVLITVLAINGGLFFIELIAGLVAHSTALLADSLDMLGDTLVYAFSLFVLSRSKEWRAMAAILKGMIMAFFGVAVLGEAVFKVMAGLVPHAETMGAVGILVLAGNGVCFFMLYRHRSDDLNMRSTWLCSRNDIIANVSVLAAAGAVAYFNSIWPDVLVGISIALLFLRTAWTVLRESVSEFAKLRPRKTVSQAMSE